MFSKPLLAVNAVLEKVKYPVLASPKLDGIRCVTYKGVALSRNLKPIANDFIRNTLQSMYNAANLDGELVTLNEDGQVNPFNVCSGDVMRRTGTPHFEFLVFDHIGDGVIDAEFTTRIDAAKNQVEGNEFVKVIPQVWCSNPDELAEFEEYCVQHGYEGVMIRDPGGRYKAGRSTMNEGILLKVKRFEDAEGKIVGYVEQMENTNPPDPVTGKRGMSKEGLVPKDTLGALVLDTQWGQLEVGSGFDEATRTMIWYNRPQLRGKLVKFKYQPSGMKDKPRFPVFIGFRDARDL